MRKACCIFTTGFFVCNVASWERDPVLPGDTAIVNYHYDSERVGKIRKSMIIYSNATNSPVLHMKSRGLILQRKEINFKYVTIKKAQLNK